MFLNILSILIQLLILSTVQLLGFSNEKQAAIVPQSQPKVVTLSGPIQGLTVQAHDSKLVDAFLGIPYAQPPLGQLRFKLPLLVESWNDTLNATAQSSSCIQKPFPFANVIRSVRKWSITTPTSEDCLFLNVWRPNGIDDVPQPNLDVLVFIHGGGFTRGSTSVTVYDGSNLAAETNTIVVTLNYRVASFGFFYLGHTDAPGNMGLWDQRLALQWIQNNIAEFGGNPKSVTVFGQSAGAVSISHHLISKQSDGLFNRAMLLSGASTANWAYGEKNEVKNLSMELLNELGCAVYNNMTVFDLEASISCAKNSSVEDILNSEPRNGFDDVFVFKPVVDGLFLEDNPKKLLAKGEFTRMDLLVGLVQEEGALFLLGQLPYYFTLRSKPKLSYDDFKYSVATVIGQDTGLAFKATLLQYTNFDEPENGTTNAKTIMNLMGDFYFNCAVNEMATRYAQTSNNVYKYLLVHRGVKSLWPEWMGAIHTDDLIYIFGDPLRDPDQFNPEEIQLSKRFMKFVSNFAKNGNPNDLTDIAGIDFHWPKYTTLDKNYAILDTNSFQVGKRFREKNCYFWNEYLDDLLKDWKDV